MKEQANGILEFSFPCGRKFGDLRRDEATALGAEMKRLGRVVEEANAIMTKHNGATPPTAKERRIVAKANAIAMTGNPVLIEDFDQCLRSK